MLKINKFFWKPQFPFKVFRSPKKWRPLNSAEPKRHIKKLFATTDDKQTTTDETAFQYSRLRVN